MNQTTLFKLGGIALAAWAMLGNARLDTKAFGILAVLMLLIALLDAGNGMQQANGSNKPAGQEFAARLFSLNGAPIYVGLLALVFVTAQPSDAGKAAAPRTASASMCGGEGGGGCGSGGCGSGGCGSSCGGSCGKSKAVASAPKAAPKTLTQEELRQRAEAVQKRAMASGGSPALPGLGANPRPLPPGVVPKAGVPVPAGVVVPASASGKIPEDATRAAPAVVVPPAANSAQAAPAPQAVSAQVGALPPTTPGQ